MNSYSNFLISFPQIVFCSKVATRRNPWKRPHWVGELVTSVIPGPNGLIQRPALDDFVGIPRAARIGRKQPPPITFLVFRAVNELGPPFKSHVEPIGFHRGILTVLVDSSAWLTELTFLKSDLLKRLNLSLPHPAVLDVRGRLRSLPKRKHKEIPNRALTKEEDKLVSGWVEAVNDQDLRQVVKRAAEKWFLRNTDKK